MTRSVLIVDDHPVFRSSARRMLETEGFSVVGEAADCAGALVATRRLRPDVVLMDVQLPDGNGFDVADALAAEGTSARIVMTSGRDPSSIRRRLRSSAVAGFIPKMELSGESLDAIL